MEKGSCSSNFSSFFFPNHFDTWSLRWCFQVLGQRWQKGLKSLPNPVGHQRLHLLVKSVVIISARYGSHRSSSVFRPYTTQTKTPLIWRKMIQFHEHLNISTENWWVETKWNHQTSRQMPGSPISGLGAFGCWLHHLHRCYSSDLRAIGRLGWTNHRIHQGCKNIHSKCISSFTHHIL